MHPALRTWLAGEKPALQTCSRTQRVSATRLEVSLSMPGRAAVAADVSEAATKPQAWAWQLGRNDGMRAVWL